MPSMQVPIKKAEEDQHLVFGVVYAPNVPDSDGEFMDSETIRKMSYDFMASMRLDKIDTQHTNELVDGARVIESFIVRKGDPDFPEGAWVVGVHVPDEITWQKIKSQEINGFSIEAYVHKEQVEVEMELPVVLEGKTYKSEDHEHLFYVSYDENGKFLGGRTSVENGHYHSIRKGTLTEETNGHSHRFAHLEGVTLHEQ